MDAPPTLVLIQGASAVWSARPPAGSHGDSAPPGRTRRVRTGRRRVPDRFRAKPDGRLAPSGSSRPSMAGLRCAEPSPAAWPAIAAGIDAFVTVYDQQVLETRCRHSPQQPPGERIEAGPSGACGAAALARADVRRDSQNCATRADWIDPRGRSSSSPKAREIIHACARRRPWNPGDIRRSRPPARSTALIPARSTSPSKGPRSSRSTAATPTRSPRDYICGKVRRFPERVYGEDRLLYPAVRKGPKGQGVFTRVTWDEALDHIAERMTGDPRQAPAPKRSCRSATADRTGC